MAHPVRLAVTDDLRRSRLTVLVRPVLAIPLALWALVWSLVTCVTLPFAWVIALARGAPWPELHGLHVRFVRWHAHVASYVLLAANPYPWFGGGRAYPLDVVVDAAPRQPRLVTLLRGALAVPAVVFASVLGALLVVCGLLAFLPCLLLGRAPRGLRDLEAYCLHFWVQTLAYLLLVTSRYPSLTYEPLTGGADPAPTPS